MTRSRRWRRWMSRMRRGRHGNPPRQILVCYRRDDIAAGQAGRMYDALVAKYGRRNVFMDVYDRRPGRFDWRLDEALSVCDIVVVVIGQRWVELLQAPRESGRTDWVLYEIDQALQRALMLIPVLSGWGNRTPRMLKREDLPESIRDLVLYEKYDVSDAHFERDMTELIAAIDLVPHRPETMPPTPGLKRVSRWVAPAAAGVACVALLAGGGTLVSPAMAETVRKAATLVVEKVVHAVERVRTYIWAPPGPRPLTAAQERDLKAKETFQECTECSEMAVVGSGSFTMGSPPGEEERMDHEGPQRPVTVLRPFAMGKHAVTFAQWDACVDGGGCTHRPSDDGWGRGTRPVVNVSFEHITTQYLPWLRRRTGKDYRLPSEAEREYVTRAGATTPFWWGSSISIGQANFGNPGRSGKTVPVDSYTPNPWGFYNLHGNIFEWVQDCLNRSYKDAPWDASAWITGDCAHRIIRGGAFSTEWHVLRSAYRHWVPTHKGWDHVGFRVARTL